MRKFISFLVVLTALAAAGVATAAPGGAEVISQDSCEPVWFGTVCTTVQATTNITTTPSGNLVYVTNGTSERRLTFAFGGSFTSTSDIHLVSLQKNGETATESHRLTETTSYRSGTYALDCVGGFSIHYAKGSTQFGGLLLRVHDPLTVDARAHTPALAREPSRPANTHRYGERVTATARSVELRSIAQAIADTLPATVVEVVLTGSVSRGVADELSDIELLLVTNEGLDRDYCFSLAARCGLTSLGTWGPQGGPTNRVSGICAGAPIELIWWSRAHAETAIDAVFTGDLSGAADAIAHGIALRTSGLLARWQDRLRRYPDELAGRRIEDAALKWGGFHAAGLLTLLRPGERLALLEWMVDDAARVVRIVFASNRVWQPTSKRLAARVAALSDTPERMAERIEAALTEPDPRRALLVMIELQLDTLALAPSGRNVDRARQWLGEGRELLLRR